MNTQASSSGGSIRQFFWPIYGVEHKKFLPLALMIACALFNYTVLRIIKDSLIVTNAGAEAITFVKVWGIIPASFIFFLIYSKLSSILNKRTLFYTILIPFIIFFIVFTTMLYPNRELLHPTESADWLAQVLPGGFHGLIAIYRYWTYAAFYVMAELWGSVVLSLLFWQFANDITPVTEAKRFYAHFYLLGNIAVTLAGFLSNYFSGYRATADIQDPWQLTLNYLISIVVAAGILMGVMYYYVNNTVLKDSSIHLPESAAPKKKKPKLSMMEGIKLLMQSKYIGLIAILVVSYGVCINLVEVSWKHYVHVQYPTENEYNSYMGLFYMALGVTTICVIFVGSTIVRTLGWRKGALATPVILGATGLAFFACVLFPNIFDPMAALFGVTPLFFAVIFGSIQNIMSKSTKYSLFDPTKEMAYIPLEDDLKVKGKAAVDVVGARFGKSGGALMQQAMFFFIGPIGMLAPYLAIIMSVIILVWIVAVNALSKRFIALTGEK